MQVSDFDFDLPPSLIALRPTEPRDAARLLAVDPAAGLADLAFTDLPGRLRPGDALVFNDTRVIPARLFGRRDRDGARAAVEATLHKRLAPDRWAAFMRPGKRLRPGDRVAFGTPEDRAVRGPASTPRWWPRATLARRFWPSTSPAPIWTGPSRTMA